MCMSVVYGAGCGETEFRCTDGRCIGYELQCNGVEECSDGSDERDCGNYAIHNTPYSLPHSHLYAHLGQTFLKVGISVINSLIGPVIQINACINGLTDVRMD